MKKKLLFAALGAVLAMASAQAAPTFIHAEQGVLFGFNVVDSDTFTLRIKGVLDATGDWANATQLENLAFKDLGFAPTGGTVSGGTWTSSTGELSANGCGNNDSGGICFAAAPPVSLTNDMTFTIDLVGGNLLLGLNETHAPHLKLLFLDATGRKAGSLLSQNMTFLPVGSPDPFDVTPVPEPASLALMSVGLLAMGAVSYRKRKQITA